MANRDAKLIKRIIQDFSQNAGDGGGMILVDELPKLGNENSLYKLLDGSIWSCVNEDGPKIVCDLEVGKSFKLVESIAFDDLENILDNVTGNHIDFFENQTYPMIQTEVDAETGNVKYAYNINSNDSACYYIDFESTSEPIELQYTGAITESPDVEITQYFVDNLKGKSTLEDLIPLFQNSSHTEEGPYSVWTQVNGESEQEQADWNQTDEEAVDYIKNKPTIPTVNNPTITFTQGSSTKGSFSLNQSSAKTIALDAVPTVYNSKITIKQGNATKGTFNLNQSSAQTITVDTQIQADWNQTNSSNLDYIKNKPSIPTVNNPTITFTQGGVEKGSVTLNQSENETIELDVGGEGGSFDSIRPRLNNAKLQFVPIEIDPKISSFDSDFVWTDGKNIYYSCHEEQFVFDKVTGKWNDKEWNYKSSSGVPVSFGKNVWTDGENIYHSSEHIQYVLDKTTSTWISKTWTGLTNFSGEYIWTDGDNIYYSYLDKQYVLDKASSTWSKKTWNGLSSFYGFYVWTDGDNIYCSGFNNQYVLDSATSTWYPKTWSGITDPHGNQIWTDGENIYYSFSNDTTGGNYILNKSASRWEGVSFEIMFNGNNVWTDGDNIYAVNNDGVYMKVKEGPSCEVTVNSHIPSFSQGVSQPLTFSEMDFSKEYLDISDPVTIDLVDTVQFILTGSSPSNYRRRYQSWYLDKYFDKNSVLIDSELLGNATICICPLNEQTGTSFIVGMLSIRVVQVSQSSEYKIEIHNWEAAGSGSNPIWRSETFNINEDFTLYNLFSELNSQLSSNPMGTFNLPSAFLGSAKKLFNNSVVIHREFGEEEDDYEVIRVKDVNRLIEDLLIVPSSSSSSS